MNFDAWQCPKCGYLVTDTQMQAFRLDYACPRCKTSFGEFVPRPATPSNKSAQLTCAKSPDGEHRFEPGKSLIICIYCGASR